METRLKTIAFFNTKAGVGKSTLVYHLAWMYAELGLRVLAVDLDPQCGLSGMFLEVERLDEIWNRDGDRDSVAGSLRSFFEASGIAPKAHIEKISSRIGILIGSLALSSIEAEFDLEIPGDEYSLMVGTSVHRIIQVAGEAHEADVVLVDLASNLGAMNRAALLAADHVVIPLVPDVYALQSLRGVRETISKWRLEWASILAEPLCMPTGLSRLPDKLAEPAGYFLIQHSRPTIDSEKWRRQIPEEYADIIETRNLSLSRVNGLDPNCLGTLRGNRTLMPIALEARKPVFQLTPSDGAVGSLVAAVRDAYADYKKLAHSLALRCRVEAAGIEAARLEG